MVLFCSPPIRVGGASAIGAATRAGALSVCAVGLRPIDNLPIIKAPWFLTSVKTRGFTNLMI